MTSVHLRPMTSTEYDAWVPAVIAGYAAEHAAAGSMPAETSLELAGKEFAELLPQGPATEQHHLLVAESDGERVGILWLRVPSSGEAAFVFDVEVEPELRGQGYGRAIMLAAEAYARDLGAPALRLHVFGSNTVARSLYESLGYETTNVQMAKSLLAADAAADGRQDAR
jgi:ribosomal protein S18 acetylase RimI-like enzyme